MISSIARRTRSSAPIAVPIVHVEDDSDDDTVTVDLMPFQEEVDAETKVGVAETKVDDAERKVDDALVIYSHNIVQILTLFIVRYTK